VNWLSKAGEEISSIESLPRGSTNHMVCGTDETRLTIGGEGKSPATACIGACIHPSKPAQIVNSAIQTRLDVSGLFSFDQGWVVYPMQQIFKLS
jgi:hypothetical protein